MKIVREILRLDELLQDLVRRQVLLINRLGWEIVNTAFCTADLERQRLIASLSPADIASLKFERARIRQGVSIERSGRSWWSLFFSRTKRYGHCP